MARYKKIYRDEKRELDKKRHRILSIVSYSLVIFWLLAVIISGIFQHNDIIVGICTLLIGITGMAFCVFLYKIKHLGWKVITTIYDSDELYRSKYLFSKKAIDEAEKNQETNLLVVGVIMAICFAVCIIAGIIKLF